MTKLEKTIIILGWLLGLLTLWHGEPTNALLTWILAEVMEANYRR